MPIFFSHIKPDLYFVGFDVTAALAKGSSTPSATNPGWFIAFEERAGEIVFGADEERSTAEVLNSWDKLAWSDLSQNGSVIQFIDVSKNVELDQSASINEKNIIWGSNSADMAYTTYQKPSRVYIHSNDMLI